MGGPEDFFQGIFKEYTKKRTVSKPYTNHGKVPARGAAMWWVLPDMVSVSFGIA